MLPSLSDPASAILIHQVVLPSLPFPLTCLPEPMDSIESWSVMTQGAKNELDGAIGLGTCR